MTTGDSWALNMKFSFKTKGKSIAGFEAEWELATKMPCRACGTPTRRMAPGVKHSIEASCSEACDPAAQILDGLGEVTDTK